MEKLINCNMIVDIETVDCVKGGNQSFEVYITTKKHEKLKIIFTAVWDLRFSIESACIDRFSNFARTVNVSSSMLVVENSEFVSYFESQASGTRSVERLKEYIVFDGVDTVVSVLTNLDPQISVIE